MTVFRYALIRGTRNPLTLLCTYILPIVIIFIRPLWTSAGIGFGGIGGGGFSLLTIITMSSAYLMSLSILTDKADGVIVRILAAPITMCRYLVENLAACAIPLFVQMTFISILGHVLYDWSLSLSIAIFLCYTVLTIASVTMAFAWHCLCKGKEGSVSGFSMLLFLTAFLGGLTFPVEAFPGPLQYLGTIFPAYWAIRGLSAVLDTGVMSGDFWWAIAAMLLFTIAYLLYGGKRRII
ncbi:MAG: ABC transporter permease [Oscillospiraceae bacterium]|nr:ABC transporter permease [Oscillospiraceae bacterium]